MLKIFNIYLDTILQFNICIYIVSGATTKFSGWVVGKC